MNPSRKQSAVYPRISAVQSAAAIAILALVCLLQTQASFAAGKSSLTGRYEGTAKNKAEEVIKVAFELTEKDGAITGMIRSDHGDFTITSGSSKGDTVTLEFDANGSTGLITLHANQDKLAGTWNAGDDGGAVDVKKVAESEAAPKSKS